MDPSSEDDHDSSDDGPDYSEESMRRWYCTHPEMADMIQPDPNRGYVGVSEQIEKDALHPIDLRSDYLDGVQVIFKLANIHLTPDKPQYNGSEWHVEGALNEHICATALFYYELREHRRQLSRIP